MVKNKQKIVRSLHCSQPWREVPNRIGGLTYNFINLSESLNLLIHIFLKVYVKEQ